MLDRVALHQTRLRTPGISLDSKGVALGAKGLVLLPSIDRLVGFLSLYSASAPLADVLATLAIDVVKSKLGHREVVLAFAAEGSDRMDRVAELARLAGGYTFTGTSRHFVQYRDAAAPFGYDVREIAATDAPLALYHGQFTQYYDFDRKIDLATLLLRLELRLAPSTLDDDGPRWICAEAGLGPALIHYFVRSQVEAEVGVCEWPPASGFDEAPVRRHLFRLDAGIPARMVALLRQTPGMTVFVPHGPEAAVELGWEHPINLRACPVFPREGLVLLRGRGEPPIVVPKLPAFGPVVAFARVALSEANVQRAGSGGAVSAVSVPLRLAPDTEPWRSITATRVEARELGLLRQLAYRLGRRTLEETKVAFTASGAYLHRPAGVEGIPVGELFRRFHPSIFVSAGYCPVPAVAPDVLFRAFGSPETELVFLHRDGSRVGVPQDAFVSLEDALLDAQAWTGTSAETVSAALAVELPAVVLESPGFRPLRDVAAAAGDEEAG
jgi:hypothetical protein